MSAGSSKLASNKVVYAYEPDQTLKELIGKSTIMADIFTKEKIAACQKLIEDAKKSFFDTAKPDMDMISTLAMDKKSPEDYRGFCKQLFTPVTNIKSQANVFGFPLISSVCKYLLEYAEIGIANKLTLRDTFLIDKLIEALQRAFEQKIVDAGGAIEKELVSIVEQARKMP